MKREPVPRISNAGTRPAVHRFPRGTLFVSIGFLLSGMRLADVLPVPAFPRLSSGATKISADGVRPGFADAPAAALDLSFAGVVNEPVRPGDVSFSPVHVPLSPVSSGIQVMSENGSVSLTDTRKGTAVWKGPVANARFVFSNISAVQTLKDSQGRVLWSEKPTPDLVFDRQSDGTASLSDKDGKTLWSGNLPPASWVTNSHSDRRGTAFTIEFAGVRISGINGNFTVNDETGDAAEVLWSGPLPMQPVLLLRDGHRFLYWHGDRPKGGRDRITAVRFAEEPGRVNITDAQSRLLGERPMRLLNIVSEVRVLGETDTISTPQQYFVPRPTLAKSGCALLSYRNKAGTVIHTSSVVRDGDRQRVNNNGLP